MTPSMGVVGGFLCAAYFLASIPFGLIVARIKDVDLRKVGSGNIGATNVYRAMGARYGLLVLFLDAIKGGLPTYMAMQLFDNAWLHVGVAAIAIVGHTLSCFVSFKGGKGVATGLGVLMALAPIIALGIAIAAALLIYLTRYVALTSILCAIAAPILFYIFGYPIPYVTMLVCIACLITLRHRSNISRLIQGNENKI